MATNRPPDPRLQDFDPTQDPAFLLRPKARVASNFEIWRAAMMTGVVVFWLALAVQWVIYDRILHDAGLRVIGSSVAAVMALALVRQMKISARNDRLADLRRLEAIAVMNHRIRNSLQAITIASGYDTAAVQESVDRIERVLSEVLPSVRHPNRPTDVKPQE